MTTETLRAMIEFQHQGLLDLVENAIRKLLFTDDSAAGLTELAHVLPDDVRGLDPDAVALWATLQSVQGADGTERLQSDSGLRSSFTDALMGLYENLIRESESCEPAESAVNS